jgi:uncharacterized protein YbaA (DUF1428 family)
MPYLPGQGETGAWSAWQPHCVGAVPTPGPSGRNPEKSMAYVDGFCAAVPADRRAAYLDHAAVSAAVFRDHGALRVTECWGDDVPEGAQTSFPMAVRAEAGEVVVFSWVEWPSREARDAGWAAIMADPRMDPAANPMPFDGKRLIYGGFQVILDA